MTKKSNAVFYFILAGIVVVPALVGMHASDAPRSHSTADPVFTDAESHAVEDFHARVAAYMTLQQKLEATVPALSDQATPEQMRVHQQSMNALIKAAREGAKQGDFLTPGMQTLVRRAVAATLVGAEGREARQSITDENPGVVPMISVNERYPEGFPVSSMPAELLQILPKLPENMEYRFLGKQLVLLDSSAQLVLDLTPDVLP